MKKLRRVLTVGLCCTALMQAWPVAERLIAGPRTYVLLRYQITPSETGSYGKSSETWWGTLRELDADAPAKCDGFFNNDAACAPHVHNVIGSSIPDNVAHVSTLEAVKRLLVLKDTHK